MKRDIRGACVIVGGCARTPNVRVRNRDIGESCPRVENAANNGQRKKTQGGEPLGVLCEPTGTACPLYEIELPMRNPLRTNVSLVQRDIGREHHEAPVFTGLLKSGCSRPNSHCLFGRFLPHKHVCQSLKLPPDEVSLAQQLMQTR